MGKFLAGVVVGFLAPFVISEVLMTPQLRADLDAAILRAEREQMASEKLTQRVAAERFGG